MTVELCDRQGRDGAAFPGRRKTFFSARAVRRQRGGPTSLPPVSDRRSRHALKRVAAYQPGRKDVGWSMSGAAVKVRQRARSQMGFDFPRAPIPSREVISMSLAAPCFEDSVRRRFVS